MRNVALFLLLSAAGFAQTGTQPAKQQDDKPSTTAKPKSDKGRSKRTTPSAMPVQPKTPVEPSAPRTPVTPDNPTKPATSADPTKPTTVNPPPTK